MNYYIVSVNHTKRSDKLVTFWGPDDCGYRFRLERSGKYSLKRIRSNPNYYHSGHNTLAVPCSIVDALSIRVSDSDSRSLDLDMNPTDRVVPYSAFKVLKIVGKMITKGIRK